MKRIICTKFTPECFKISNVKCVAIQEKLKASPRFLKHFGCYRDDFELICADKDIRTRWILRNDFEMLMRDILDEEK